MWSEGRNNKEMNDDEGIYESSEYRPFRDDELFLDILTYQDV